MQIEIAVVILSLPSLTICMLVSAHERSGGWLMTISIIRFHQFMCIVYSLEVPNVGSIPICPYVTIII
ncbi:hypothetical protein GDO78_003134 [Eleutherodactylus coqui]|uniref:Secreted protein n=1 Tax=Eleutherodactylus coqui TaxID=57060 RepID=A0A8J6K2H3_ELECQ|nr:hypothetical protein GDO78_003134 [Eleutherodactylus coqui]